MNCPYDVKVCTKCKRILIACDINFKKSKKGKYGFASQCKECDKQYREENKEMIAKHKKEYYENNRDGISEYWKEYYKNNKDEKREYQKQYRETHKEEVKERNKQYRESHKEEIAEKKKQHYQNNKEQILEKQKQYHKDNPHISFNNRNKRRQLEENQGNGITKEQWLEMMEYFDWCCAYSGEYIGGDSEFRTIDHIIPLSKGGEHEVWNCVPMYNSYNYNKYTNDMEEWYRQQEYFSKKRLEKIYIWIEYAWSKWGMED